MQFKSLIMFHAVDPKGKHGQMCFDYGKLIISLWWCVCILFFFPWKSASFCIFVAMYADSSSNHVFKDTRVLLAHPSVLVSSKQLCQWNGHLFPLLPRFESSLHLWMWRQPTSQCKHSDSPLVKQKDHAHTHTHQVPLVRAAWRVSKPCKTCLYNFVYETKENTPPGVWKWEIWILLGTRRFLCALSFTKGQTGFLMLIPIIAVEDYVAKIWMGSMK